MRMRRMAAAMLVAATAGGCAGPIRRHIYYPASDAAAPVWRGEAPAAVTVTTGDGVALRGLYWAPRAPHRDILVYFHGNGGHLLTDATRAEPLAADGHGVLMTSYRGYSGNPGRPSEAGLARDAAAFTDHARSLLPPGGRLYLFGHSLGAAVALNEAARRPVDAVATLGAFANIGEFAPAIVRPFLPDRFDDRAAIARIAASVTLFHGTRDETVPFADAARLAAASGGRARVVPLDGADHHPDPVRLAPLVWQALERGTP